MLTIRPEQMAAFREAQLRDWLERYLQKCYPARTKKLGQEALAELVRNSAKRARKRGLALPEQIRKYVHVEFLLGSGFEERFAWAGEIMGNPDYKSDLARLRALEDAMLLHFKKRAAGGAGH